MKSHLESKFVFWSICLAIQQCHENGISHRDLKPENMFFADKMKRVKLLDFGSSLIEGAKELHIDDNPK